MVCAAWHGVQFDIDDDVVVLPNKHCTCPQGCRCRWIPAEPDSLDDDSDNDVIATHPSHERVKARSGERV